MKKGLLVVLLIILSATLYWHYVSWYCPLREYHRKLAIIEKAEPGWFLHLEPALRMAEKRGFSYKDWKDAVDKAVRKEALRRQKGFTKM